jgi:hypothetical protein
MGKKLELLQQIQDLENASRGWLEDDKDFETRVQTSRKLFQAQFGIKNKNNKSTTTTTGAAQSARSTATPTISSNTKVKVPVSKWVTPVETKQSVKAKKKAKLQKGDVFGAMMVTDQDNESDEDDDSDHEDDDEKQQQTNMESTVAKASGNSSSNRPTASASSNKKKKNKKKPSGDKLTGTDALIALNTTPSTTTSPKEGDQATMPWSILSLIQTIVVSYLLPLLLAILQYLKLYLLNAIPIR